MRQNLVCLINQQRTLEREYLKKSTPKNYLCFRFVTSFQEAEFLNLAEHVSEIWMILPRET